MTTVPNTQSYGRRRGVESPNFTECALTGELFLEPIEAKMFDRITVGAGVYVYRDAGGLKHLVIGEVDFAFTPEVNTKRLARFILELRDALRDVEPDAPDFAGLTTAAETLSVL